MTRKKIAAVLAGIVATALVGAWATHRQGPTRGEAAGAEGGTESSSAAVRTLETLQLSPQELQQFKVVPLAERTFIVGCEAVGSIDFNQEMSTDVFPPVQGKILKLFASAGDDVKAGTPLYTVDSPDLVQAGSTLISAAGVLDLTTRALKRSQELRSVEGISQKDLDQVASDQQAAEATFKAARDAVRIFGKTEEEMDTMVKERKIDPVLIVRSPITGRITARNAAPGVLAQPGIATAPYTVCDLSTLWMLADVAEGELAQIKIGQPVDVAVRAFPGRVFHGNVVNIGAAVDPSTRRVAVRSVIADPAHELRPGMFATFVIRIGESRSPAVPMNGVIREGDGTISVWVAQDSRTIVRRRVKIGLRQDGFVQILEGVAPSELVATESAIFLSNALSTGIQ